MITRFTHDVDAKEVLTKLKAASPGPQGPEPIQEVQFGGKTCLDLGTGDTGLAYAPRKDTIVVAPKEKMAKVLAVTEPRGPLYERLKTANADSDLIVAAEIERIPGLEKMIDAGKQGAPQMENFLEGARTLRGVTLALSLTGDSLLQIVLETKDAAGAETVEGLLKDGVKMLDGGLAMLKQNTPQEAKAQFGDALKLGDEAIAGVTVTKSGSLVTAVLKRPADLDKAMPSVEKAILAYFTLSSTRRPMPPRTERSFPAQPGKFE